MDLKQFADKKKEERKVNSKFISLNPEESFIGEFVSIEGFKSVQYGNQVAFKFIVNGETKTWNRGDTRVTSRLINDMVALGVVKGTLVKIIRLANDGKSSVLKVELVTDSEKIEPKNNGETTPRNQLEEVFEGQKN